MKEGSRCQRLIVWLAKGDPLWSWLAFFIFIIYVVSLFGFRITLDARLRWIGMFFQFAGLLGVIVGLKESRQLFNRPGLSSIAKEWLKEFVEIFRKPIPRNIALQARGMAMGIAVGSARLTVTETLEEKVRRIERELVELQRYVEEGFKKSEQQTKALVGTERESRVREIGLTNQKIETALIGGINLELGGAIFLFLGVLLTSIPEELAKILKHILPL